MRSGQSLFEIVIALGLGAVIVVGIISVAAYSTANITFSRTQSQARTIAQETIEWLRAQRNKSWADFSSRAGVVWCLPQRPLSSWSGAIGGGCNEGVENHKVNGTIFFREVNVATESATVVSSTVSVSWTDSKGVHETRVDSTFTDFR